MERNPFYHRGPIREPGYFCDRQQETEQIASLLRVSPSVSVVGPRRIGKTSMLYHLLAAEVRTALGLLPPRHLIASVDAEGMDQAPAEQVHALLVESLHEAANVSGVDWPEPVTGSPTGYRLLDRALKQLGQAGTTVAFFIDEFELLAANRNLDPTFFSGLRGLATRHAVSYLVASQSPLISLVYADNSVLSSPFFNIFVTVPLRLFAAQAAPDMLAKLLAGEEVTMPEAAVTAALELAGPHPFFLQMAAYHAYELAHSASGWDEAALERLAEAFYAEAQSHFLYYWHNLSPSERHVLANLPLEQGDVGVRESLQALEQQGLVFSEGTIFRYLSPALERFVRQQEVADLLQAGPFVIDLRQRTVAAGADAVKLTKTQFDLLCCLAQRRGQVVTNRELEESIWRDEYVEDPERLKAAVKHLRRALGPWGECIGNERGVGYALRVKGV